jgi:ABC-2 type transport system permease protein
MRAMVGRYLYNGKQCTRAYYIILLEQYKHYKMNVFMKFMGFPIKIGITLILWGIVTSNSSSPEQFKYFVMYYVGVLSLGLMYPFARVCNSIVARDILDGELARYMLRGIPYWCPRLADWLVTAKWFSITVIPLYIIFTFFITKDISLINIIGFILIFFIGSLVQLTIWLIIGMSAFILEQTQGISRLYSVAQALLMGALIPLHFLPNWLQIISSNLPLQYFLYVPLQVLLGEYSSTEVALHTFIVTFWLIIMLIISLITWKVGTKYFIGSKL